MSAIIEHFAAFMAGALVGITVTALWALARRPDTKPVALSTTNANPPDKWPCTCAPESGADTTEIYLDDDSLVVVRIFDSRFNRFASNFHTLDQARQMRAQLDAIIAQIEQRLPDRVEFDETTGRVTVSKGEKR